jgi:hypothetical protein
MTAPLVPPYQDYKKAHAGTDPGGKPNHGTVPEADEVSDLGAPALELELFREQVRALSKAKTAKYIEAF